MSYQVHAKWYSDEISGMLVNTYCIKDTILSVLSNRYLYVFLYTTCICLRIHLFICLLWLLPILVTAVACYYLVIVHTLSLSIRIYVYYKILFTIIAGERARDCYSMLLSLLLLWLLTALIIISICYYSFDYLVCQAFCHMVKSC